MFIKLAFLFCVGCTSGWLIELIFRRFFSKSNKDKAWKNPGFLRGPWLPLYGFGLCLLYILSELERYFSIDGFYRKVALFILMAASMTVIEYLAGVFSVKLLNAQLWDYSEEWGNFQGLICPKFSFFWTILGICYYYFLHRHIVFAAGHILSAPIFLVGLSIYFIFFTADIINSLIYVRKMGHPTSS